MRHHETSFNGMTTRMKSAWDSFIAGMDRSVAQFNKKLKLFVKRRLSPFYTTQTNSGSTPVKTNPGSTRICTIGAAHFALCLPHTEQLVSDGYSRLQSRTVHE